MKQRFSAAAWMIVAIGWIPAAHGQTSGQVLGSVRDASGAIIPFAAIGLTNVSTNVTQQTTSTSSGDFVFPIVPVGTYTITAEKSGFEKATVPDVSVVLGQSTRVDLPLRVAGTATSVNVSAAVETLQTTSAAVKGLVAHEDIVNLPLNGLNVLQLQALQPNAVPAPKTSFLQNYGGYTVVAGTPAEATSVTLDGVNLRDINDFRTTILINPDAVQEFQETQSNHSASTVLTGGAQVNLVTRSGSNSFHGTLFEFLKNDVLDARNFFAPANPPFRQNQFGGTLGGPIRKDKTFFFGAYEGIRVVQHDPARFTVPTVAQRGGNFQGGPVIYDPLNLDPATGLRIPFPDNIISTDRISPQSAKALSLLYPLPTLPGTVANLAGAGPNNQTTDQTSVRIDHSLGERDSLYGRYIFSSPRRLSNAFTSLPNFADTWNTPAQNAVIGWIHTFGSHTTNQFRLGYQRMTQILQDSQITVPINQMIGITGTSTQFLGNPAISITGLNGTGGISNAPNNRSDNGYYLFDDLNHIIGSHSLNVGFFLAYEQVNGGYNSFARGQFVFRNQYTSQLGSGSQGNAVADFVLGFPATSAVGLGTGFRNFRQHRAGLYVADSWRATSNLTVEMGLRWEHFGPGQELRNHLSGFDPQSGQIVTAGINGVPPGLRNPQYKDFAPRVGLAYRVGGSTKTAIRAGYGLNFMPLLMFPFPFSMLVNAPFFTALSVVANPLTPNLTLANAFPAGVGSVSTALRSFNKNFADPNIQQWNLSVERELPFNAVLTAGYLGNHGVRLANDQNINAPYAGAGVIQAKRPFPAFSNIVSFENIGASKYHAGFLKLERRFAAGLMLRASYTYSKLLDMGGINSDNDIGTTLPRNPLDPHAEYGRSYFDSRHRFVGSFVWQLPVGKGRALGRQWSTALDLVAGGWQMNGIVTSQTGLPVTPFLSFDNSNTGLGQDQPDCIANPNNGPRTTSQWFNTSAFVLPVRYSYGNCGRNIITGPGINNIDFSLFKIFRIRENMNLQFRSEFFNLINHPNFNQPGTTFGTPSFGVISSALDPRIIQFALKLAF
jgi:hypothetical protein